MRAVGSRVHGAPINRLIVVGAIAIVASGCNSRLPVIDEAVPVIPSAVAVGEPPPPLAPVPAALVSLIVSPAAVFSGSGATGRVGLSFPASTPGLSVALSSGDAAVAVPTSISVAAGATSAEFPIVTSALSREITVSIGARSGDRAVQATLALWFRTPPFIASWTDQGNGQPIAARRVTSSARWRANCYGSDVSVGASDGSSIYSLLFGAPQGTALTPGTYDNAQPLSSTRSPTAPKLDILAPSFTSAGCAPAAAQSSRFVVTEADFVADQLGTVRRFTATFEQRCGTATIRGEASLVGVSPTVTSGPRCLVPR